tara:strand:+ start:613 stop:822 length:210 start_codon:yes stop_codon:yes gene_type:complete
MGITNKHLHDEMLVMKQDLRDIKKKLLDPDDGAFARVNRNTGFRKSTQKTLWSIWVAILGIIGKLLFWD